MSAPRPIDFSISDGRIGAPKRKGASKSPEPKSEKDNVVLKPGELRVKVSGTFGLQTIAFPAEESLNNLFGEIAEVVGSTCACKLLLNGALLGDNGKDESEKDNSLTILGASPGCTIMAICSKREEIQEVLESDSGLTKFDGRRTFEQEAELERRRARAKPMFARKTAGSLQDYSVGFSNIVPLQADPDTGRTYTHPPPAEALKLLEQLAHDPGIEAVMKKYHWRVGMLTELPPSLETGLMGVSDHCLLGLNVNKGEAIKLRLRTSDLQGFRPYLAIKETLLHELTHMVHSDHDASFWSLFRVLMREADEMDWTKSTGRALAPGRAHQTDDNEEAGSTGRRLGHGDGEGGCCAVPWAGAGGMAALAAQERENRIREDTASKESKAGGVRVEVRGNRSESDQDKAAVGVREAENAAGQGGIEVDSKDIQATGDGSVEGGKCGQAESSSRWECGVCTLVNAPAAVSCDACGTKRSAVVTLESEATSTTPAGIDVQGVDAPGVGGDVGGGTESFAAGVRLSDAGTEREVEAGAGPVSEIDDGVKELEGLGFARESAVAALARFKGSVARAADWLLSGRQADAQGGEQGAKTEQEEVVVPDEEGRGLGGGDVTSAEHSQLRERMERAVQRFVGGLAPGWAEARTGLSTLLGMVERMLQHPGEDKYRRVRLSNTAFVSKIARHAGGKDMLLAANFRHSADGEALEAARTAEAEEGLQVVRAVLEAALQALP